MIATALLSSSSFKSSSTMTTTTSSLKTTEQQVRTLIPVTTSDGSKLFVSGPCIVLKTQTPTLTVAQQMQALRPLLKAETNTNVDMIHEKYIKTNDRNNNNNNDRTISDCFTSAKESADSNAENEPEPLRCKRRIDFSSLGLPRPQPAAMARRNERERNRVKQVNQGFETLRQHVPQGRKNKKLSKVDTLKEAVTYIKYLHDLLLEADEEVDPSLTAAISDTITMVSRPTATTTATATTSPAAVCKSETSTTTQTSSAVTASTNTTSMEAEDLIHLPTPARDSPSIIDFASEPSDNMNFASEPSDTMDFACQASDTMNFACESASRLSPEFVDFPAEGFSAFKLDQGVGCDAGNDVGSVAHLVGTAHFGNVAQGARSSGDNGGQSPSLLVELAPAQPNFLFHKPHPSRTAPVIDIEHRPVTIVPTSADLPSLPPPFNTALPSSLTYMDFSASSTPSPDYPAHTDYPQNTDYPQHTDYPQYTDYPRHTADFPQARISELQSLKMELGCRGSDGSCPVSPGESSGASDCPEDCLGESEGETWQDLSSDIAEWLCSKIDIDDPDVFV